MVEKKTLFDDNQRIDQSTGIRKEATQLERIKNLEDKITIAIERVKSLKEEKVMLQRKIRDLEELVDEKNQEIEQLMSEKGTIRDQIESLLNELEMYAPEKE